MPNVSWSEKVTGLIKEAEEKLEEFCRQGYGFGRLLKDLVSQRVTRDSEGEHDIYTDVTLNSDRKTQSSTSRRLRSFRGISWIAFPGICAQ